MYSGNIRKDRNAENQCVTEILMRENLDDGVKERFPLRNANLMVKTEEHEGVHDYDKTKSINTVPSHFGS